MNAPVPSAEPSLIDVLGQAGIDGRSDFELEQLIDDGTLVGRARRECEAEIARREAARQ